MSAAEMRERLVDHLREIGGWVPTADLVAWMRSEGWARGAGERDLRQLVAGGRVSQRRALVAINGFGALSTEYRA